MPNPHLTDNAINLHFVETSASTRADVVRVARSIGCHCEPYADFSEIAAHPPRSGIVIIRDDVAFGGLGQVLDRLLDLGISLPVVAIDFEPSPSRVVQAAKDGALDYLVLPLKPMPLAASISRIVQEAAEVGERRTQAIAARQRLSTLSRRELQVLDALVVGGTNEEIARTLEISRRTVEVHRANLMSKLGAKHAVAAVRIKLDAHLAVRAA